jgi:epsilon-lactone hydrolase
MVKPPRRAMHPLMFRVFIAYCVVSSSVKVLFRRLFHGRAEPSWSLPFEVAVDVERRFMENGFDEALHGLAISDAPVPRDPRVAARVALSRDHVAGLDADVHTPKGWREGDYVLLYWHGGGYISCSPRTHRDLVSRIAHASGARCIVPNYRKAPAHPFPAALDAAVDCFHALIATGVAPDRLLVGGDSAGGGLALAMTLRLRDAGGAVPRASVLLSPWVDLTGSGASVRSATLDILSAEMIASGAALYAGTAALDHPHVSPLHANLEGLPPMLVQTGEREVFYSENITFVERARTAGVSVTHEVAPGMIHVFQTLAFLNARSHEAIRSIGTFMRGHRG